MCDQDSSDKCVCVYGRVLLSSTASGAPD